MSRCAVGVWHGPDDQWPDHQKPFWADALRAARAARWHLRTDPGHNFGLVACKPRGESDRCELAIYSTGAGTESFALRLMRMVKNCPHRDDTSAAAGESVEARSEEARRLLAGAARLTAAAEDLLQASSMNETAQQMLADAEDQTEQAIESILFDAVELESEADRLHHQAQGKALADGVEGGGAVETLDEADARVDHASRGLAESPRQEDDPLVTEARRLKERIKSLRARL